MNIVDFSFLFFFVAIVRLSLVWFICLYLPRLSRFGVCVFPGEHHVHFDQTTLKDDDVDSDNSCVTYHQVDDNIIGVRLGFLQINHRYLIELRLPSDLFKCNTSAPINLVADDSSVPNIHCKLADTVCLVSVNENGVEQRHRDHNETASMSKFYSIKVEFCAYKEKLLREELKLINTNNSVELLKLVMSARVLGKGKGTPMLRNGIHCIGSEPDDETDLSEDQNACAGYKQSQRPSTSSTSNWATARALCALLTTNWNRLYYILYFFSCARSVD